MFERLELDQSNLSQARFIDVESVTAPKSLVDIILDNKIIFFLEKSEIIVMESENTFVFVSTLFWCIQNQKVIILLNRGNLANLESAIEDFKPDAILWSKSILEKTKLSDEYNLENFGSLVLAWKSKIHLSIMPKQSFVLLQTSGTTTKSKFVALSWESLFSNALRVRNRLRITSSDVCMTQLNPSYGFGLSVLLSHALAGSLICLNNKSILSQDFIRNCRSFKISSLVCVPATLRQIDAMRNHFVQIPSLRYIAQAGGAVSDQEKLRMKSFWWEKKIPLLTMYGQTEAGPRITSQDPDIFDPNDMSCGKSLDGQGISIASDSSLKVSMIDKNDREIGEIVCKGDNVHSGYCRERSDLAELNRSLDILNTGDLGYIDANFNLFVSGRVSRMVKLGGVRYALDDLEGMFRLYGVEVYVNGQDDQVSVYHGREVPRDFVLNIAQKRGIAQRYFRTVQVEEIPLLANGKVNYVKLSELDN